MDAPGSSAKYNRWLPYWAVFQADLQQTINSWVYRLWVLGSMLGGVGYLLYRFGWSETGWIQNASVTTSQLLRYGVLVSITLIIVLTGGAISSERGTLADSILSRGISRYQYFLGKWHARLAVVLITVLVMSAAMLLSSYFLLHEDLDTIGSLYAILTIIAILGTVATCGVTVSAIANSTLLGIAVLWTGLFGIGIGLTLMPRHFPCPDRILQRLEIILRGNHDPTDLVRLIVWSCLVSIVVSAIGLSYFSRRDV